MMHIIQKFIKLKEKVTPPPKILSPFLRFGTERRTLAATLFSSFPTQWEDALYVILKFRQKENVEEQDGFKPISNLCRD